VLDRQVGHLVRLVDDLLDVARINRGDIVLQKRAVPLAEIVTTALETSRPLVEARGHRLSVQLPGKPVIVMGDPLRLSQVLANVLNNAATYTPVGGQIEITVETQNDRGVLRVRDNGPGISPATARHMFDLFMRGDDARNHPAGFGIGLALARRLIEMHGGSIRAESAGPNLGSEFFITLPIEPLTIAVPEAAPVHARSRGEKKVLVVDDNADAAESLALLLDATGATTSVAYDGPAALRAFAEQRPDVVLLDIGMPGMDGYEVARSIRERWPQSGATLVALTGWGQEEDRRRTAAAGFDHHLVKPAGFEEIEAILESL
jgi:CheY-like chemotaxis protein